MCLQFSETFMRFNECKPRTWCAKISKYISAGCVPVESKKRVSSIPRRCIDNPMYLGEKSKNIARKCYDLIETTTHTRDFSHELVEEP